MLNPSQDLDLSCFALNLVRHRRAKKIIETVLRTSGGSKVKMKTGNFRGAEITRMTKFRLILVRWDGGAKFPNSTQCQVKQNQSNPGSFSILSWKLFHLLFLRIFSFQLRERTAVYVLKILDDPGLTQEQRKNAENFKDLMLSLNLQSMRLNVGDSKLSNDEEVSVRNIRITSVLCSNWWSSSRLSTRFAQFKRNCCLRVAVYLSFRCGIPQVWCNGKNREGMVIKGNGTHYSSQHGYSLHSLFYD